VFAPKFWFIQLPGFRGEIFLEINQSETDDGRQVMTKSHIAFGKLS
jgi:hypothetical protein